MPEVKMETVEERDGLIVLNMGPQHPSTHGVLRLELHLDGETIVRAIPHIGYLHRGVEKLCEHLAYVQIPPIMERNDYLAAMANAFAYVHAVETLMKLEVPKRAQYLRVIVVELQRIASHLVWLGTWGLDLGGAFGGGTTLFLHCFRERERILDLFEMLTGSRLHYNFFQIGGVRYDVPAGWDKKVKETLDYLEGRFDEYEEFLDGNAVFLARTQGVGVLPPDLAKEIGASGPVLRGSGVAYDVRKTYPYSSYEDFEFEIPVGKNGDCYDRFKVRMAEMRQSVRIVRQALEGLPEGPIGTLMPLKVVQAVRPPKGEAYARVESPRGELGAYLVSDGTFRPYRLKWRAPSFSNLAVIPHILPGHLVADVVAILGSLDPVFGDVDR